MATLKYYGHACWELKQDTTSVLIDPWFTGNPHAGSVPADLKPTLILVTHAHGDHLGDAVAISKSSGAAIVATPELANWCTSQGAKAQSLHMGGTLKQGFGWVKTIPAFHTSSIGSDQGPRMLGTPVGFIVNFFGTTIYHAGDTCVFGDMKLFAELTPIDIAILPMGGHFTMDVQEATKAVELIRPKVAIPMHYKSFPVIQVEPEEFQKSVDALGGPAKAVVVPIGGSWEIPSSL